MPKVSVIVPVYGEKYIERCVRSLLDQTLDDVEFIFVDDRSPDSAYEIVLGIVEEERYSHLKDKIKIVRHEKNKGVQFVRLTGLEASTGDYIIYCDSDDWVDRDILRKLWEKAVEGDYDIVECSYYETDGKDYCKERTFDNQKEICYLSWLEWPRCTSLTDKIIRRSLYQNEIIRPENPYLEDFAVSLQLFYYAKNHYFIYEPLYYYYMNPSSIMHSVDPIKKVKGITEQESIMETFMRREGLTEKYRSFLTELKHYAASEAWKLPWKEFMEIYFRHNWRDLFYRDLPLRIRLGILSKVFGIHGISGKKRG